MRHEGDLDAQDWLAAADRWTTHIDTMPDVARDQIRHCLVKAREAWEANSGVLTINRDCADQGQQAAREAL